MKRFTNNANKENLITLKKRKQTLTDVVNEQLVPPNLFHPGSTCDDAVDSLETGIDVATSGTMEEYEWDNTSQHSDETSYYPVEEGRQKRLSSKDNFSLSNTRRKDGQLRQRGPLYPGLSKGRYSATPIDIESAMEDIFGALDMADLDAENEELYGRNNEDDEYTDDATNERDSSKNRHLHRKSEKGESNKRRRVKDLTEDEYIQWLSEKKKERLIHHTDDVSVPLLDQHIMSGLGLHGEEGAILEQLESLRRSQLQPVRTSTFLQVSTEEGSSLYPPRADDSKIAQQGKRITEAVKYLGLLYTQFLHVRMKLQPAVSKAVGLPQYYARPLFVNGIGEDAKNGIQQQHSTETVSRFKKGVENEIKITEVDGDAIRQTYADVRDEIRTILDLLFQANSNKVVSMQDESVNSLHNPQTFSFLRLQKWHSEILNQASDCLSFWGDKFTQTNSSKLKAISQPLMKQIESILSFKHRLRLRVQKNRAHLPILGHPEHFRAQLNPSKATQLEETDVIARAKAKRAMSMAGGDIDEEIYDDSDFLRGLVRHKGFTAYQSDQRLFNIQEKQNLTAEASKKRFHRLTKGKSVKYEPRPKLVGFIMAKGFEDSGRNDVVLKSLFQ